MGVSGFYDEGREEGRAEEGEKESPSEPSDDDFSLMTI